MCVNEIKFKTKKYFKVKLHILVIIVFFNSILEFQAQNTNIKTGKRVNTVVIDPGHGGRDPGAVGLKSKEKDIVLDVSLIAGRMIREHVPGVQVFFTREKDVFVELFRRAKIANDKNADLFISVHCNASRRRDASGTEVFVMGLDKSQQNLEIAKKENASILLEDNYELQYEGIDPNSSEAYIVFSLFQHAFFEQSLIFARKSMNSFDRNLGLVHRGVKQAPFLVLWRTVMPSVLVEIGFISNAKEEQFMLKKENQDRIAYSIYTAFVEYKNAVEGTQIPIVDFSVAANRPASKEVSNQNLEPKKPVISNNIAEIENPNDSSVVFKVQLFIDRSILKKDDSKLRGISDIKFYFDNGVYKYVTGSATNFKSSLLLLEEVRKLGFEDAFIVAFRNGKRIPNKEAREETDHLAE